MGPSQITSANAGAIDSAKAFVDGAVCLDRVFDNHQKLIGNLSRFEARFVLELVDLWARRVHPIEVLRHRQCSDEPRVPVRFVLPIINLKVGSHREAV